MKDVLTIVTFGILALCFAVFLTMFKPDALSSVPPSSKAVHCKIPFSCTESRLIPERQRTQGAVNDYPS